MDVNIIALLAPLYITYVAVLTKLLLDYLTTREVFHGPKNQ